MEDKAGSTGILTEDTNPIRLPQYILTHKSREVLREEIQILLYQVIIKPSNSLWAAPTVLVVEKKCK